MALAGGGGLVATLLLAPYDAQVLAWIQQSGANYRAAAEWISQFGRFENSLLMSALVAGAIAIVTRSPRWRDVAVAVLVAALVAGLAIGVLRPTFGRARPDAGVAAGFYWFEADEQLHSLPSGYVASNAAAAFALVPLLPPLLVPAVAYTGAMAWSRMQLNRHYPTDVMWGAILGATVGLAIGTSIRDRRRRLRSTSDARS